MMTLKANPLIALLLVALVAACQQGADDTGDVDPDEAGEPAAETSVDPALVTQGDAELNAHGMSDAELVAMGGELWNDPSLSTNGSSCATCHVEKYEMMKASFAEPYPHPVDMAKNQAGLDEVNAAEMIQLCMVVPMAADPLAWDSQELAALTAYVEDIQPGFDPSQAATGANPCNPCAANPCAANPCGANPCAANPCAANPCGANPCAANPCKG